MVVTYDPTEGDIQEIKTFWDNLNNFDGIDCVGGGRGGLEQF